MGKSCSPAAELYTYISTEIHEAALHHVHAHPIPALIVVNLVKPHTYCTAGQIPPYTVGSQLSIHVG